MLFALLRRCGFNGSKYAGLHVGIVGGRAQPPLLIVAREHSQIQGSPRQRLCGFGRLGRAFAAILLEHHLEAGPGSSASDRVLVIAVEERPGNTMFTVTPSAIYADIDSGTLLEWAYTVRPLKPFSASRLPGQLLKQSLRQSNAYIFVSHKLSFSNGRIVTATCSM